MKMICLRMSYMIKNVFQIHWGKYWPRLENTAPYRGNRKYAHVTYFFNGGEETPNIGEDRILVPSPKVATYDLKPEMSAPEVTEKLSIGFKPVPMT